MPLRDANARVLSISQVSFLGSSSSSSSVHPSLDLAGKYEVDLFVLFTGHGWVAEAEDAVNMVVIHEVTLPSPHLSSATSRHLHSFSETHLSKSLQHLSLLSGLRAQPPNHHPFLHRHRQLHRCSHPHLAHAFHSTHLPRRNTLKRFGDPLSETS